MSAPGLPLFELPHGGAGGQSVEGSCTGPEVSGLSSKDFRAAQCERRGVTASGAVARRNDTQTSWDAARSVRLTNLGKTRDLILLILRTCGPQKDEDLIEYFQNTARNDRDWDSVRHVTEQSIRSRRKELVRLGLVADSGDRAKTRTGRDSIIWRLK